MANKMTLFQYYKENVYHYGYDQGWLDRNKGIERPHRDIKDDIFYQDEEDYYICADYYGMSVDGFTDEDKKFLEILGFCEEDFTND